MPNEHVKITVSPDGEVTIEGIGFTGEACERMTREIEEALGTVDSRQRKPEYYQRQTQNREQGR